MTEACRRPHFLEERCTYGWDRLPFGTAAYVATCVAVHYANADPIPYDIDGGPWYACLAYSVFHLNAMHLWNNMVVLIVAGTINELIGGVLRMLAVMVTSAAIAACGHGLLSSRGVIGASGVVYAVIVYQLALVVKNWREMRVDDRTSPIVSVRSLASHAVTRLVVAVALLVCELVTSLSVTDVSHGAHIFGAVAGFTLALAIGSNVKIDRWEIVLPLVGLGMYSLLVVVAFVTEQNACGGVLIACTPVVIRFVCKETARWTRVVRLQRAGLEC